MDVMPFDTEATEQEICELLAALVRVRKPTVVVEAGTYRGHGALYMADTCRRNGVGHVYTFDPVDHGLQYWLAKNSLEDWCTFIRGEYAVPKSVDFAFIDASAIDETGRMNASPRALHFEATRARLSPGGIICVHDTHCDSVWYDEEGGASMHRIRESCFNLDLMRGLSVYYKGSGP